MRQIAMEFVTGDFIHSISNTGAGLRWKPEAIEALQEAAEAFLVHLFEDA